MRRKSIVMAGLLCLTALLVLMPLVSSCGSPSTTGKTLKVGMITPTTGPAAEKGAPGGHGLLDAVQYINTDLNGVNGYKIEPVWRDSAYDMAKVVTITKELMDQNVLMFTTHSSTEMKAAMEGANRAEFPGMATFTSASIYHPPAHIYGQMPDYGDDWVAFTNYYMKNLWKGTGKPKMALFILNNPTGYGARDAARAMADQLGVEIVATEEHTATTISEMESLTRVKAKNPDIIYISSTPAPTSVIIKNVKQLAMNNVVIASGAAGFTKALIDLAGKDVAEGVYGAFHTVTWEDNVPGIAKATEYCKKNNPKDYGNMDYLSTWAASLIVRQILTTAVKNVGYDTLTKGGVNSWRTLEKNGIQKLASYDVEGLQGPVSYVPGDNRLAKALKLYQIKGGNIAAVTGWIDAPLIKYEDFSWFGK